MMINLSFTIHTSVRVHPGVKKNLCEGNHLGEDEPDINHLHIGSGREALGDTDEEGCQDKEGSQVDCHHSFKKEVFEEVCSIDDDENKNSWKVDGEDGIIDSSFQNDLDMHTSLNFIWLFFF